MKFGLIIAYRYIILLTILFGCGVAETTDYTQPNYSAGLYLPHGFEAVAVIDSLEGRAREIAVNDNGDVYVKISYPDERGGCAVLRDNDGDGKADQVERFGIYEKTDGGGYQTAMRIHDGYLYFSSNLEVYRHRLTPGKMEAVLPQDMCKHKSWVKVVTEGAAV